MWQSSKWTIITAAIVAVLTAPAALLTLCADSRNSVQPVTKYTQVVKELSAPIGQSGPDNVDLTAHAARFNVELHDVTDAVREIPNWSNGGKPLERFSGYSIEEVRSVLRKLVQAHDAAGQTPPQWSHQAKVTLRFRIWDREMRKWVNAEGIELRTQGFGWIGTDTVVNLGSTRS